MSQRRMRGFGLVEVLVSLVIIAVGLLGIAKIQMLAYAETGTAAARSIAAIQASSMAASMRANRSFWAVVHTANPLIFTINGATFTVNDASVPAMADCTTAGTVPCSSTTLAAYDVQEWVKSLVAALGANSGITGKITCDSTTLPVNCTILIHWTERLVGASGAVGAVVTPDYTLYVAP